MRNFNLSKRVVVLSCCLFSLVLFLPGVVFSTPTSGEQAERVVQNWLAAEQRPLDEYLGASVSRVETFRDDNNQPLYHIVYLEPDGFVIISGDDLVEPIVGFAASGDYDPSSDNPLGALVTQDIPGRVQQARAVQGQGTGGGMEYLSVNFHVAKEKWDLYDHDPYDNTQEYGMVSISDVRVAPFLTTFWDQETESGGNQCYNLYTPNNYPSGCVATAAAQLMRFFQFPTTSVGTGSYSIEVDDVDQTRNLLGGNGFGGAYNWSLMDNGPAVPIFSHRQAIGRLLQDVGISVNMSYRDSSSGAETMEVADALKNTFGYSNAIKGYNWGNNIPSSDLNTMTNPNLDAGYPVIFGITGSSGGHAIIGDGYGYNSSTLYHHMNMGWGGSYNAWYNLPTIDTFVDFTSVYKTVYNVYTTGSGEIISGRVTDSGGNPISGASVTAVLGGGGTSYSTTTNANGIYALAKILSGSTYTVSVTTSGYTFSNQTVSTLTSADYTAPSYISTVGNKWGINFVGSESSNSPAIVPTTLLPLLLNSK